MRHKYWRSPKTQMVVNARLKDLNLLLDLANADLNSKDEALLLEFLSRYAELTTSSSAPISGDKVLKNHSDYVQMLLKKDASKEIYLQRECFAAEVQLHLAQRIQDVMDASKMLWNMPLWEMNGTIALAVDPISNRFYEGFLFKDEEREEPVWHSMSLIDLRLIELIRDLDLKPERFRRCKRCKRYFYQPTARKKKFCGTECADADRIQRFWDKKRGQNKDLQKNGRKEG